MIKSDAREGNIRERILSNHLILGSSRMLAPRCDTISKPVLPTIHFKEDAVKTRMCPAG